MTTEQGDFVPVGEAIDLDNCAREPIHVPGSVQPRGVLVVLREPELVITQVSANTVDLLGVPAEQVLDGPLAGLVGNQAAQTIERAVATFGALHDRNPLELTLDVRGESFVLDAILHREPGGILFVELENAYGPRPFSFPNTYQAVRGAVGELNRAASLNELYQITATAVRDLTGFDRVMVYRYDHEYNGEVVAEAKREDLNPFLGLHYPASDIPAQARALYEKNWIRLISDVDYTPAPLVPAVNPMTGQPLDLTFSTLRSVSPIHVEYLQNMGVGASMSISLLREGKLWGLIACHHYSGPHLPPYGTRAAAEFLGSTLSLRLVDRAQDELLHERIAAQAMLAKLTTGLYDESESIVSALLGAPDLLDLVAADAVAVSMQGRVQTRGEVPSPQVLEEIVAWAVAADEEVVATDCLARTLPHVSVDPQLAAGALAIVLPGGQYAIWLRAEARRAVDWGGDPHNKALAVQEGNDFRISPRRSFERWREIVELRSQPWTVGERDAAGQLRRHLVESMYQRSRGELRMAEALQRSLLPTLLPQLPDWQLSAHYEPAAGGRIGGDWYDAFRLRDGRLVVVLGDVAGHGIGAAGTMAQLRNSLRAYLFVGREPADALNRLNELCTALLPGTFATAVVAVFDLDTGAVTAASAGHLLPLIDDPADGTVESPIAVSPPLGVAGVQYQQSQFVLQPGWRIVLFSDGLVERRGESIGDGLDRLMWFLADARDTSARAVWNALAGEGADAPVTDDVTVVTLRRPL
ncbi:SpoIIE family protein phosphatase [uncultured Jatrophihabitans sp.]|uniref:SpoIIE family protein phosphatase n=1 Tax=uncultured Jatrophihabitans sp. TaxID=1610747 RepID=UPI0035CB92FC